MYVLVVEKLRFHDDPLDDESESGFPLTTTNFNNHSCLSESSYLSMSYGERFTNKSSPWIHSGNLCGCMNKAARAPLYSCYCFLCLI